MGRLHTFGQESVNEVLSDEYESVNQPLKQYLAFESETSVTSLKNNSAFKIDPKM